MNSTWDREADIECSTLAVTNTATCKTLSVTGTATISILSYTSAGTWTFGEGANIVTGTSTGTIIAATAAQKLGFWGITPVVQPASANQAVVTALTDNSGGASGGNTIAVVTDVPSAANAIATLAAKTNALNTLVTALRAAGVASGLIKGAA